MNLKFDKVFDNYMKLINEQIEDISSFENSDMIVKYIFENLEKTEDFEKDKNFIEKLKITDKKIVEEANKILYEEAEKLDENSKKYASLIKIFNFLKEFLIN